MTSGVGGMVKITLRRHSCQLRSEGDLPQLRRYLHPSNSMVFAKHAAPRCDTLRKTNQLVIDNRIDSTSDVLLITSCKVTLRPPPAHTPQCQSTLRCT